MALPPPPILPRQAKELIVIAAPLSPLLSSPLLQRMDSPGVERPLDHLAELYWTHRTHWAGAVTTLPRLLHIFSTFGSNHRFRPAQAHHSPRQNIRGHMMIGSSKSKSKGKSATAMPPPSEATTKKKTAEVLPSNKRKRAIVSVCASAPLLPDDMILEVLLRLPVKSILRFRAVCRSWAAMLSSKEFCSLHMATSKMSPPAPRLLVLSPAPTFNSVAVYACSPSSPVDDLLFTFDCARRNSVQVVTPSPCYGLTLLYDAAAPAYYVCNAATRAITRLPPHRVPTYDSSAGLGFDAGTGEYKVVRLMNGFSDEKETIRCDVCAPGADRWRPANGGVPFKWFQFANSAVHHAVTNKIPPVFAHGSLHWLINPSLIVRRLRAAVVSFSVAEETFGCVRSPPFWGPREHLRPSSQSEGEHLVVMDDRLCIVRDLRNRNPHGGTLEIWGLLDYGSGDWSLNHRIDLFGQVKSELAEQQVVRVIGAVGNCKLGKKIVIATSKHLVRDKFQKKVYSYDPGCQVLEGILSVTETHTTSVTRWIPGSRFSLIEESLAPVHKTHEDLAFKNVLKKLRLHAKRLKDERSLLLKSSVIEGLQESC